MKLVNPNDFAVILTKADGLDVMVEPFNRISQPGPQNATFILEDPYFEKFIATRQLAPMPAPVQQAMPPPERPFGWRERPAQVQRPVQQSVDQEEAASIATENSGARADAEDSRGTTASQVESTIKPQRRGRKG